MKWKNRDVFVVRPLDDERVVIQEVFTGNTEHVRKSELEGYNEEAGSKEVKQGLAPNAGDKEKEDYRADVKVDQKIAEQRAKYGVDVEKAEKEGRTKNFKVTSESPYVDNTPDQPAEKSAEKK